MKRFTLISLLVLIATMGFAQRNIDFSQLKRMPVKQNIFKNVQMLDRSAATSTQRKAPRKAAELVTPPSGKETEQWYIFDGGYYVSYKGETIDVAELFENIGVIIDGNDIYFQGLALYFKDAWVKGTIDGSTVTIPTGQFLGSDSDGDEYLVGYDMSKKAFCDIKFAYDSEKGLLTLDPNIAMLENGKQSELAIWGYWMGLTLSQKAPELVTPPAGEGEDWVVGGVELTYDEEKKELVQGEAEEYPVKVIIDGSDFYVQGLSYIFPEAWVKGTIADGKVTFATGQYLGVYSETDEESGESLDFNMFLVGLSTESAENTESTGSPEIVDLVYTYDEENQTLTNETTLMVISVKPTSVRTYLQIYCPVVIYKPVDDGISTINSKKEANVFYNLQGVKMAKPTQKGIYIVNGKKVVVK